MRIRSDSVTVSLGMAALTYYRPTFAQMIPVAALGTSLPSDPHYRKLFTATLAGISLGFLLRIYPKLKQLKKDALVDMGGALLYGYWTIRRFPPRTPPTTSESDQSHGVAFLLTTSEDSDEDSNAYPGQGDDDQPGRRLQPIALSPRPTPLQRQVIARAVEGYCKACGQPLPTSNAHDEEGLE